MNPKEKNFLILIIIIINYIICQLSYEKNKRIFGGDTFIELILVKSQVKSFITSINIISYEIKEIKSNFLFFLRFTVIYILKLNYIYLYYF